MTSERVLESTVKARMVKVARDAGCYARRYEDQFAVGIPDMEVIPVGGPVFKMEVKVIRSGRKFGPTPRQLVELTRLQATQCVVPLVVGFEQATSRLYAGPPAPALYLEQCLQVESIKHLMHLLGMCHEQSRKSEGTLRDN